jgi:O-antigen biosynthesis protein WbqP
MQKRAFDVILGIVAAIALAIPLLLVSVMVRITSKGPILYWSDRVGKRNKLFRMAKFRSMRVGTPVLATHLLDNPDAYLTPVGSLLRRSSLDELPQIWSIIKGDMSFVGPRPALFNQHDLIALRSEYGVDNLTPGLTGWAQINGRDDLPLLQKAALDFEYSQKKSVLFDCWIIMLTVLKVFRRDGVAH